MQCYAKVNHSIREILQSFHVNLREFVDESYKILGIAKSRVRGRLPFIKEDYRPVYGDALSILSIYYTEYSRISYGRRSLLINLAV